MVERVLGLVCLVLFLFTRTHLPQGWPVHPPVRQAPLNRTPSLQGEDNADPHLPCVFVLWVMALYEESVKRKGLSKCKKGLTWMRSFKLTWVTSACPNARGAIDSHLVQAAGCKELASSDSFYLLSLFNILSWPLLDLKLNLETECEFLVSKPFPTLEGEATPVLGNIKPNQPPSLVKKSCLLQTLALGAFSAAGRLVLGMANGSH